MKKRFALGTITLLSAALLWQYAFAPPQLSAAVVPSSIPAATVISATDTVATRQNPSLQRATRPTDERVAGRQQRQQAEIEAALQQMHKQIKGQNLQQWLHQLWANCQKAGPQQCLQTLDLYQQQLSTAEAAWLQQLLAQYHDYQQLLAELVLDNNLDKPTQYNEVRKLRQRLFAEDYSKLFGQEQQFAEQQFAFGQLLAQREQLDAAQRLDALFAQQQQLPAQLQPLLSADLLYQQALDMLADLPDSERQAFIPQLQQRYFGAEAEQVAQHEARQAGQQQQRELYLQQRALLQQQYANLKQQLLAENASASQLQQWQQEYAAALAQLRQQHFGS